MADVFTADFDLTAEVIELACIAKKWLMAAHPLLADLSVINN